MEIIGALLVDKPAGITSHDAVAALRRAFKQKRIGHTGTLDPFATGLLIVCMGRATRLAQFLTGESKEYDAVMRLGYATDTQDRTGKPIGAISTSYVADAADLRGLLSDFVGEQRQLPPMFSAKKVAGEALYKMARRGEVIERKAVQVFIEKLELIDANGSAFSRNDDGTIDVALRVRCSSGTYVRTLAHDIGERLGCGAHLAELRRTAVGDFLIADAARLDEIVERAVQGEPTRIIKPAQMVGRFPSMTLSADQTARVKNGQPEYDPMIELLKTDDWVRCLDGEGELAAMAQAVEFPNGRRLQPRILLM